MCGAERDHGAEGVADEVHGPPVESPGQHVDGRRSIDAFVDAAPVRPTEVEAEHRDRMIGQTVEERTHHVIEPRPAVLGVRVAQHHPGAGVGHLAQIGIEHVPVRCRQLHPLHVGTVARAGTLAIVTTGDKLPIKMLNDRLLVKMSNENGERQSSGGILIPATAQMAKRLVWAEVVALGQNVRAAEVGDRVLFSPDDRYEVEVQGADYIMLRERDLHAVAAERIEGSTGLYL